MTDTAAPAAVADAPVTLGAPACDVCGHPMTSHDRISTRFCDATQAGALSRGCICRL
jgi:hypothetical protein